MILNLILTVVFFFFFLRVRLDCGFVDNNCDFKLMLCLFWRKMIYEK